MNKFITREHDKFSNKTTTKSMELEIWDNCKLTINLRHVSTPNVQTMVIDILYGNHDWMYLNQGSLILNINGTKNITLTPHEQDSYATSGNWVVESDFYELSQEELLMLCKARTIEYKLSGSSAYVSGEFNENMQLICKAMYNAVYDQTKFLKDITKAEDTFAQEESQQQAQQEALENRFKLSNKILAFGWIFGAFALVKSVIALWNQTSDLGMWFIIAIASAVISTIIFIILRLMK